MKYVITNEDFTLFYTPNVSFYSSSIDDCPYIFDSIYDNRSGADGFIEDAIYLQPNQVWRMAEVEIKEIK